MGGCLRICHPLGLGVGHSPRAIILNSEVIDTANDAEPAILAPPSAPAVAGNPVVTPVRARDGVDAVAPSCKR
jgi:hypothetical protein